VFGSAIMKGTGFQKRSGKFSLEDLIGQAVSAWIEQYIPKPQQQQTETNINPYLKMSKRR